MTTNKEKTDNKLEEGSRNNDDVMFFKLDTDYSNDEILERIRENIRIRKVLNIPENRKQKSPVKPKEIPNLQPGNLGSIDEPWQDLLNLEAPFLKGSGNIAKDTLKIPINLFHKTSNRAQHHFNCRIKQILELLINNIYIQDHNINALQAHIGNMEHSLDHQSKKLEDISENLSEKFSEQNVSIQNIKNQLDGILDDLKSEQENMNSNISTIESNFENLSLKVSDQGKNIVEILKELEIQYTKISDNRQEQSESILSLENKIGYLIKKYSEEQNTQDSIIAGLQDHIKDIKERFSEEQNTQDKLIAGVQDRIELLINRFADEQKTQDNLISALQSKEEFILNRLSEEQNIQSIDNKIETLLRRFSDEQQIQDKFIAEIKDKIGSIDVQDRIDTLLSRFLEEQNVQDKYIVELKDKINFLMERFSGEQNAQDKHIAELLDKTESLSMDQEIQNKLLSALQGKDQDILNRLSEEQHVQDQHIVEVRDKIDTLLNRLSDEQSVQDKHILEVRDMIYSSLERISGEQNVQDRLISEVHDKIENVLERFSSEQNIQDGYISKLQAHIENLPIQMDNLKNIIIDLSEKRLRAYDKALEEIQKTISKCLNNSDDTRGILDIKLKEISKDIDVVRDAMIKNRGRIDIIEGEGIQGLKAFVNNLKQNGCNMRDKIELASNQLTDFLKRIEGDERWLQEATNRLHSIEKEMYDIRRETLTEVNYAINRDKTKVESYIVFEEVYNEKIKKMPKGIRINVGCGRVTYDDYINVDLRPLTNVDVVAKADDLPFKKDSIGELYSAHLVEHIPDEHMKDYVMPYWYSLIKPGGIIRVVCPNWIAIIDRFKKGEIEYSFFRELTFGSQEYQENVHRTMYTVESIKTLLKSCGFKDIEVIAEDRDNGGCPEMEIKGVKPKPSGTKKKVKRK